MAAIVTATCIVVAYPIAYYMARVASPRVRGVLAVAVLMPLWASYLVKAYAWRLILSEGGVLDWALKPFGLTGTGVRRHRRLARLRLPLAAVHDPADLRRPRTDPDRRCSRRPRTSGGRGWMTFRRVILPLSIPAVAAGSIFTFSLTLGDYIVPGLVSTTQFIGNVIFVNVAQDLPLAAAYSLVPLGDHADLPVRRAAPRRLRVL